MLQCGGGRRDCTVDHFFHSSQARSLWNQHKIGEISETEKDKLARRLYDEQHHQEGVSEEGSELENKKDFENSLGSPTLTGDECPLGTTFLNSPDWIVYSSWERNHHQLGSIQGIGS